MRTIIKEKRGIIDVLGPHTFEIIMGVLCTALIIGAIVKYIDTKNENAEKKQATNLLSETIALMNKLKIGESTTLIITGIEEWNYVTYRGEGKPAKCLGNKCLCLCPQAVTNSCESEGVCRFPYDVTIINQERPVGSIEVSAPVEGEDERKSAIIIRKTADKQYQINYKSQEKKTSEVVA
jgi:hypothetical protein